MLHEIQIAIIGNGNVGTYLYNQFHQAGLKPIWYSRTASEKTKAISQLFENDVAVDLLLLCVSDDAIAEVSKSIKAFDGMIAHLSGAQSIEAIARHHRRRAVFYPLMSIKKDLVLAAGRIPFCLEAKNNEDMKLLESLTSHLGAQSYQVNSDQRTYLHLAAVLSHNFGNHLYHKAQEVIEEQGLDFKMLLPLLENAIQKLYDKPAFELQTGPAVRHDQKTIEKHLSLLNDNMSRDIYKLLTQSIQNSHDKKL